MTSLLQRIQAFNREAGLLFLLLIAIGTALSLLIPYGWGHDESVHAYRADAVSRGSVFVQKIGPWHTAAGTPITVYGDYTSDSLITLATAAADAKTALSSNASCVLSASVTRCPSTASGLIDANKAAQAPIDSEPILTDFWGANSYAAVGYLPSAVGFGIARVTNSSAGNAIHLGRLGNVIATAVLCTTAFLLVAGSRFRWVIAAIALSPFVLVLCSSLGIDGLLVALSLLLAACYHRLVSKKPSKTVIALAIVASIALPLLKLPYILLSLPLLLFRLSRDHRKDLIARSSLAAAIVVPSLLWNHIMSDATRTQYLTVNAGTSEPNAGAQLHHILTAPTDIVTAFIRTFATETVPSLDHPLQVVFSTVPQALVLISIVFIATATLYACTRGKQIQRLYAAIFLLVPVAIIGGIALMMYLNYNPVGATTLGGLQGRYLIPLIVFVSFGVTLACRITIQRVHSFEKYVYLSGLCLVAIMCPLWIASLIY